VQAVLKAQAHAEVRREAKRRDHFRSADLCAACGRLVGHFATIKAVLERRVIGFF
jgi:hypothetical protein